MTLTVPFLAISTVLAAQRGGADIEIHWPLDGLVVRDVISTYGVATLPAGAGLAISLDGAAFEGLATQPLPDGSAKFTRVIDTRTLSDGLHNIRFRVGSTSADFVFEEVDALVRNVPQALDVLITSPVPGAPSPGQVVVAGLSQNAELVELSVDGGPFEPVQGTQPWSLEIGPLAAGVHTLVARATAATDTVIHQTSMRAGGLSEGLHGIAHSSSVDGEPLTAVLSLPPGLTPGSELRPLVVWLHGGGGTGRQINRHVLDELDARGWIGISPDGRSWSVYDPFSPGACSWKFSSTHFDSPDPGAGPGEQDTLDSVDWALEHLPVDPSRIYIAGFSMGARGAYQLGLRNPDRFAAVGACAPAVDMFEIFVRSPGTSQECQLRMAGGAPGDSPLVDTMHSIQSARFLIENACNLPVYHGHGTLDQKANNDPANAPYLHGSHMTVDATWVDCHGSFCFGHTPVLDELNLLHPDSYDWAYMFSPVGHAVDRHWIEGTAQGGGVSGTPDPEDPAQLIGMMEFFARRSLVTSPELVVYKSYTSSHAKAYWAKIEISRPDENLPGAIRARRSMEQNSLDIELARVDQAAIDLAEAGLRLDWRAPLVIDMRPLQEPAFDPALDASGEVAISTLVLQGRFAALGTIRVELDGSEIDPALLVRTARELRLGPLQIGAGRQLVVNAGVRAGRGLR